MSQYKEAEIGNTVHFWFAANTTAGAAGDGATPLYDVRLAGAASDAAPTASGTPTLLSHANYTDGLHEIAIETTSWAAGEYAVFCTLTISSVNPAGFCGSFRLKAAGKSIHSLTAKTPSKDYLTGTANSDGDIQASEATGNFPGTVEVSAAAVDAILDEVNSAATHNVEDSLGRQVRELRNQLRTGTAQGGTDNTITLDAAASALTDYYKPGLVVITGGTGAGQCRRISAYNGTSKVATLATNWVTNPDNISTFSIWCWATVRVSELDDIDLSATMKASVNAQVDTAIADARLDELLAADSDIDGAAPPTVGSVFHKLLSKTAGSFTFDQTTDSLEAIRDKAADVEADTQDLQTQVGVDGAGLTAIGDARIANLDATVSSRLAPAGTLATVTNLTNAPGAGDLTATMKASVTAAVPTAAANADAVWDETLSEHLGAGSTGNALNAAGSAGDPWATAIPGGYGAGSAGKILGDNINAPIATVDTVVDAVKAKTDLIPPAPAAVGDIPTATENADALLDRANAIETGWTIRKALRVIAAALAGKLSGAATATVTIRNITDAKDRITATVDADGNRTAVSLDGT